MKRKIKKYRVKLVERDKFSYVTRDINLARDTSFNTDLSKKKALEVLGAAQEKYKAFKIEFFLVPVEVQEGISFPYPEDELQIPAYIKIAWLYGNRLVYQCPDKLWHDHFSKWKNSQTRSPEPFPFNHCCFI